MTDETKEHRTEHREIQATGGKEAKRMDDNTVYIGKKGAMAYVLAVVTQLNSGTSEVFIKARGRAISRAVDVAEIVRNKFMSDLKIGKIDISTEEVQSDEGNTLKVSAIEILLRK
ncbi:MAG: DNA-binding protein Alba [Candidatus Diapherotrites archaeon]|nr:DNA-binding protein Alba [Candidatus Diapherotrites archaeon]